MANLFTKEELLQFNEMMLGRGMPVTDDGIGYSKADFGACTTYFYGLSDAQLADLAKRLVKYSITQLGVNKEDMKATAKALAEIADPSDRSDGISLNITENGTLFSFRYNEDFIEIIKKQPKRQWDSENKNWIIPNGNVINTLQALEMIGADVKNAIEYASEHELIKGAKVEKNPIAEIEVIEAEDEVKLSFNYNQEILDEIRSLDRNDRTWYSVSKCWGIKKNAFPTLQQQLASKAVFKQI